MANMSANMLRDLISGLISKEYSVFPPHKVELSGELPDNGSFKVLNTIPQDWWEDEGEGDIFITHLWVMDENFTQLESGYWDLEKLLTFHPDGIFVVEAYIKNLSPDLQEIERVAIYKLPDSKEYWKKVAERDIERWEKWLNA